MNNADSEKLRGVLELLVDSGSRINQAKPRKYWYPLSQATFGVDEILEALDSMCSFRTSMWEKTAAFEAAFAQHVGARHAIMVNSGSSADLLMCLALMSPDGGAGRLRPGDEILIPAVTWPTQIWSALLAGFKVRLVDVDPHTLNASIAAYHQAVTPRTRAIFAVHLMGIASGLRALQRFCQDRNLVLIEDCCEAQGTTYDGRHVGTFGAMGAFSFFFAHHMCTMEGGAVVTDSDHLADTLRTLRAHGWCRNLQHPPSLSTDVDPRYAFISWGLNVRPTELQAGFGIHQLKKVDGWNATRRKLAATFANQIATHPELKDHLRFPTWETGVCDPSFFALPLLARSRERRDYITRYLEPAGIETRPIVAGNIARHPVADHFECLREFQRDHPNSGADQIHDLGFYVGLSPLNREHDISNLLIQLHIAANRL